MGGDIRRDDRAIGNDHDKDDDDDVVVALVLVLDVVVWVWVPPLDMYLIRSV